MLVCTSNPNSSFSTRSVYTQVPPISLVFSNVVTSKPYSRQCFVAQIPAENLNLNKSIQKCLELNEFLNVIPIPAPTTAIFIFYNNLLKDKAVASNTFIQIN